MLNYGSGHGGYEPSRNQVGAENGIESPIAHETSILKVRLNFSSSTCALSFFSSVSLRNSNTGEIDSCEESIRWRNQFLLKNQCP
jgi:hypothetical protein